MFTPGPMELVIILAVVLLIFGPGKLPQVGAGLGKGIRGFSRAVSGKDEGEEVMALSEKSPAKEVTREISGT